MYGITVISVSTAPGTYPVTIREPFANIPQTSRLTSLHSLPGNISWSPVVLVGTVMICYITWRTYGNKHYSGPIKAVTKWETGVEIDLQSALTTQRSKPSGPDADSAPVILSHSAYNGPAKIDASHSSLGRDQSASFQMMPTTTTDAGGDTEWTDATATSASGGTGSTFTRDTMSRLGIGQTGSIAASNFDPSERGRGTRE